MTCNNFFASAQLEYLEMKLLKQRLIIVRTTIFIYNQILDLAY